MSTNFPAKWRARLSGLLMSCLIVCSGSAAWADDMASLVKTMTLEPAQNGVSRSFFGSVSAKQAVDLGFQVGGRMISFTAPEGEIIEQGDIIAELDPVPFEIEVERARLAKEQADRTVLRFERLLGSAVSEAEVLDARTNARLAAVSLDSAEYALSQSTLRAPFDAVVAMRNVGNFSTVAAGTQIVRLLDLSELRVEINVPETLVQVLGENPDVTLTASFPGSDKRYPLIFREANAETSEVGQTFQVTLAMEAPVNRLLLPGASVTVSAKLNDQAAGIPIPPSAIRTDANGQTFVMQVSGASGALTVTQVPVELSVAPSGEIVLLNGTLAGTEIVVGGVNDLTDGQHVRRFVAKFN